MKTTFLSILLSLFLAGSVLAAPLASYTDPDGNSVMLDDAVCANEKIRSYVVPGQADLLAEGTAVIKGVTYPVCWAAPEGSNAVVLIFEDKQYGALPDHLFKPATDL